MNRPLTPAELKAIQIQSGLVAGAGKPTGSDDLGKFTFSPQGTSFEMVGGPEHQRNVPIVSYQVPNQITDRLSGQLAALQNEGLTYGIGAAANARLEAITGRNVGIEHVILDNPGDATPGFANRYRASRDALRDTGASFTR